MSAVFLFVFLGIKTLLSDSWKLGFVGTVSTTMGYIMLSIAMGFVSHQSYSYVKIEEKEKASKEIEADPSVKFVFFKRIEKFQTSFLFGENKDVALLFNLFVLVWGSISIFEFENYFGTFNLVLLIFSFIASIFNIMTMVLEKRRLMKVNIFFNNCLSLVNILNMTLALVFNLLDFRLIFVIFYLFFPAFQVATYFFTFLCFQEFFYAENNKITPVEDINRPYQPKEDQESNITPIPASDSLSSKEKVLLDKN